MSDIDDIVVNPSYQDHRSITGISSNRRKFIGQATAFIALMSFGSSAYAKSWGGMAKKFTFGQVPIAKANDDIVLPNGYRWAVMAAWGSPVNGVSPVISKDVSDSFEQQELQFGMHHDGGAFFPEHGLSNKGLWVVNHEYSDDGLLHPQGMANWSLSKIKKSQAAHGVAVAHVERGPSGAWRVVNGPNARRITAYTPCQVSGPAAGADELKTLTDPSGRLILGTLNNCASGVTPWGTYLTCEENFNLYFSKTAPPTKQEARLGINKVGGGYRWHEFDERFSVDKNPNEVNRFGWVVEIDPQNPQSTPIKRTALGRFKHEGANVVLAKDRRVVVYMGDDQKGEYIYKYVSRMPYEKGMTNPGLLLDDGTLYVAKFNADGSGSWIALEQGKNGLNAEAGFTTQAQILVNARMAADFVGATPMDRPEWIASHPKTGEVYVTLTNNSDRGKDQLVDAANPRKNNVMGKSAYVNMPNNAMYASDPLTKEYRRFLIGPKGCEITGIDMTPDCKTMFINIQHPGETASERNDPYNPKAVSSWPDRDQFSRPRSATIAIWREDGREVGV